MADSWCLHWRISVASFHLRNPDRNGGDPIYVNPEEQSMAKTPSAPRRTDANLSLHVGKWNSTLTFRILYTFSSVIRSPQPPIDRDDISHPPTAHISINKPSQKIFRWALDLQILRLMPAAPQANEHVLTCLTDNRSHAICARESVPLSCSRDHGGFLKNTEVPPVKRETNCLI